MEAIQQANEAIGDQLQFYAAIFCIACAAGLSRTFRDHLYSSFWNLLSVGICSGFIGLGCVTLLAWILGGSRGHELGMVAIAIFVGLLGKEADKLYPTLLNAAFKRFGITLDQNDQDDKE